jgi:hypothetical protein
MTYNRYNWAPIDYYTENNSFHWRSTVRGIDKAA